MRLAISVLVPILVAAALLAALDPAAIMQWAVAAQRGFQNEMAGAIRALRAGDAGAWTALLGAAWAYGFVHAVGPGHGKFAIGGVGLGVDMGAVRLVGIAFASSLAQALWAILLVYGGLALFEGSAMRLTGLAENVLAPLSYVMIGAIGAFLAWRGTRTIASRVRPHDHHHHHHACGCGGHGPAPAEIARLTSWRESLALILGIAVRPCTGAVFLLVIAWQMDLRIAGLAAVLAMGAGTALLTGLVAVSAVAARGATILTGGAAGRVAFLAPALQVTAGLLIVWGSAALL